MAYFIYTSYSILLFDVTMKTTSEKNENIDKQSYVPAYIQLVNILKDQISDGRFLPGSKLPSESELCRKYKVSPMTVRRSINTLLDENIVSTIRGSGTYVRYPDLGKVSFGLGDFQSLLLDRDRTKVNIIEVNIIKADERISQRLAINCGDNSILIRRILINNGDPVIYHSEHLVYDPYSPIVEGELEVTSLYGLLVGSGKTHYKRGNISIEAVKLSKEEADILDTVESLPAFRLEHIFFDFKENPVSWGKFICRGDWLKFHTTIGISKNR
ncbi:MAG: GntR family transcriptional regulator [Deltaproteobacteria bacterium]|nr:GntR family transcriptional regulator [Deltaproteobacteria bacterium]